MHRLLEPFADELVQQETRQQAQRFTPSSWFRRFPEDDVVRSLAEKFNGRLTRADLHDLGRAAWRDARDSNTKTLFLAVMMWGYGTRVVAVFALLNRRWRTTDVSRRRFAQ